MNFIKFSWALEFNLPDFDIWSEAWRGYETTTRWNFCAERLHLVIVNDSQNLKEENIFSSYLAITVSKFAICFH